MAISLDLRTCRLGKRTKAIKNPFDFQDGAGIEVPDDDGFSSDEKTAIKTILDSIAGPDAPPEYIDWSTELDDGGIVEIWAPGLGDDSVVCSLTVVISRRSPFVMELLFQLSKKGNLVVVTQAEGVGPWLTSADQMEAMQRRWPSAHVVSSASELTKQIALARDELEMDID